jgi:hypothetical protein
MEHKVTTRRSKVKMARQLYLTRRYQKKNKDEWCNGQLDQECETCMSYQIWKCYQICHIVAYMGGDVIPRHSVVIIGTSASHNILQHPSTSFSISHQDSLQTLGGSGIHGIGIEIKLWSSGSNEACLCIAFKTVRNEACT